MGTHREVFVPDIGDFKNVDVIEVLVKPGDAVQPEQSLIAVESDKATMEIPSPAAGVVREMRVKTGDKVSQGSPILILEETEAAPAVPAPVSAAPAVGRTEPVSSAPAPAPGTTPHASPSVRKFARELGVDLVRVRGSGPKGRITQADVQEFVKGVMRGAPAVAAVAARSGLVLDLPEWPQVDFVKFGPVETKPLSRIRKLSGGFLHRNWVSIPHVTQHDEADITELEAFRKENAQVAEKEGFKLTMLAFLVKASVNALRQFPDFNASLDKTGENLIVKKYYHIGVAVDTPDGLVVPVIRDADVVVVFHLARQLADLSMLAVEGEPNVEVLLDDQVLVSIVEKYC